MSLELNPLMERNAERSPLQMLVRRLLERCLNHATAGRPVRAGGQDAVHAHVVVLDRVEDRSVRADGSGRAVKVTRLCRTLHRRVYADVETMPGSVVGVPGKQLLTEAVSVTAILQYCA